MKSERWPNKLGWDVWDHAGESEVMEVSADRFRVHADTNKTDARCLLVRRATVNDDPRAAVMLCRQRGFLRSELESMRYEDAEQKFRESVL